MTMTAPVPVSIVVPAHDEAAVIGRCLASITSGSEPGAVEVVVVCNGCADATARVARAAWPPATVVELPGPSKADALNVGDAVAHRFPRFYVDADVSLSIDAVRATARLLTSGTGVLCAAPRPTFDLAGRSWPIRAFYETWDRLPYLNEDVVGSGVYALSEAGRKRFGRFPALTADDQFVLAQFERGERRSVPGTTFTVHAPTSIRGLTRIRRRAYRGTRELARADVDGAAPTGARGGHAWAIAQLAREPRRIPALVVYVAITAGARAGVWCSASSGWERDDSARAVAR